MSFADNLCKQLEPNPRSSRRDPFMMNAVGMDWVTPGLPGMNAVGTEWFTPGLPG